MNKENNNEDNRINRKVVNILLNIARIISLVIIGFLFFASFTHTAYFYTDKIDFYHEGLYYSIDNIFINVTIVLVLISIMYLLNTLLKKIKNKRGVKLAFFILIAIFGLIWNFFIKAPIKADQAQVFNDAKTFAKGDFTPLNDYSYLYQHPLQLGIVVFECIIMKLFNTESYFIFKIINVLCITISMIFMYKISELKIKKNDDDNYIFLLIMISLLVIPFYTVVVYGNVIGFMFSIVSIYYAAKYLKERKVKLIIVSVLSAFLAYILKSNYVIMIIATCIILILDFIKNLNYKTILFFFLLVLIMVGAYPLLNKCVESLSGKKINKGIPMVTYIAMSINQKPISRNSGWYGEDTTVETIYHASSFDYQDTVNVSNMIINDRINYFVDNPIIAIKFYQDKICSTWIEPTFQTIWWAEPLEEYSSMSDEYKEYVKNNSLYQSVTTGKIHEILIKYLDGLENIILIASIIAILKAIIRKENDLGTNICLISFVGGFLFHILWETKCIYVIPFYLCMLPYCAEGLCIIFDKIDKFLKTKIVKGEK